LSPKKLTNRYWNSRLFAKEYVPCELKVNYIILTFVNVYAPTEDTEDEIVDEFYETLQSVCDELPKYDAVITLGDFKAKLGKEQIYRDIIGIQPT
jgi:hypothetical protein